MPVLTAAACTVNPACPAPIFPTATAACVCTPSVGGVNDLYFIPCTEVMSEENITDAAGWWTDLLTAGSGGISALGNIGTGLGSIAKKSDVKKRYSSCKPEQVVSVTWGLKYQLFCFDKSVDKITHEQVNNLITNANKYLLIARMCDGENTVLPIGPMALSDFDWTVPDNNEEDQSITLELSWKELGLPKTYEVAGLSAVVPKA